MIVKRPILLALAIVAVCIALAGTLLAQYIRGPSGPRGLRGVGWGPTKRHYEGYISHSTGLDSLHLRNAPSPGSGVLGSSIYAKQSMTLRQGRGAAPGPAKPVAIRGDTQRRVYTPYTPTMVTPARQSAGRIGGVRLMTASAGADYVAAVGAVRRKLPEDILKQVITSLVPPEPARHRESMFKGEDAFRKGEYAEAMAYFETARQLSDSSPESLLSLGRTCFAMAEDSYARTAEYLSRTLEIVPELPQVHIFPRSFYGKQEDYLRHAAKLEAYVHANPRDPQAQLVLGYVRWRQSKPEEARKALGIVLARGQDRRMTKAAKALLASMVVAEEADFAEPPEMGELAEYPWAGLRIAIPKGFEHKAPDRTYQVLQAARVGGGKPVIVALAAFPVGQDVTARDALDHVMGKWQRSPDVDELSLVENRDVTIAGLPAFASLFTYTVRGDEAAALGLCTVREIERQAVDAEPLRIVYGLLVRTTRDNMAEMIGVVNGVADSAELTELHRPIDLPIELTKEKVHDLQGEYALRLPRGWTFSHDQTGVVLAQIDYLLGGVASPSVNVISLDVPESMTAKACGESALAFAAEKRGHQVKILKQGPVMLGGQEGYQFVVEKRIPLASEEGKPKRFGEPFIQIDRMLAGPVAQGRRTYHVIILTVYKSDAELGESVMDKLAEGFTLLGS